MPLTEKRVEKHLKMMLGGPLVDQELTSGEDSNIETIITQALRVYSRWRPIIRWNRFVIQPNRQRYDLTAMSLEFGERVVDVRGPVEQIPFGNIDSTLLGIPGNILPTRPANALADFLARTAEIENIRRATATNFDWEFRFEEIDENPGGTPDIKTHGVLYISPAWHGDTFPPQEVEYSYAKLPDLADVRSTDEDWLMDFCLALAKVALGHTRRKWEDRLRMDGSSMVTEGTSAVRDLTEEIKKRGVSFWYGPRQ